MDPSASWTRLVSSQQIQEGPRSDNPHALVFFDLQKVGIPGYYERGAAFERRSDVLIVIWVGADASHLMFAGNHFRKDEDVLEPQLGFGFRAGSLPDLGVGERVQDLRGDLG